MLPKAWLLEVVALLRRAAGLESRGLLFIVFSTLGQCPYLLKDGSMADKTSYNSPNYLYLPHSLLWLASYITQRPEEPRKK